MALSPFVFHRDGEPVGDFRKAWATVCIKVGLSRVVHVKGRDGEMVDREMPTRIFHDLRRSAVRNMVRANVPQSVAMEISGHRTAAVFMRYAITAETQKREALRRTQAFLASLPAGEPARVIALPTASGAR